MLWVILHCQLHSQELGLYIRRLGQWTCDYSCPNKIMRQSQAKSFRQLQRLAAYNDNLQFSAGA